MQEVSPLCGLVDGLASVGEHFRFPAEELRVSAPLTILLL